MKTSAIAAALGPAALAYASPWWGGAPDCAQDCFSSFWSTASDSTWPAPTNYCGATQAAPVSSCINSACSATPTAVTSYSSLSSSLCAQWSSCSSAGSTSVFTVNLPAFTGSWGPGSGNWGGHHGGPGGPGGEHNGPWGSNWDDATKTWTGGVYTVTGCEWDGSPWAGGPGGWGAGGGRGGSPWGAWGHGWDWSTETKTITKVITSTGSGVTALSTSIGLATVAQAVSGDSTTSTILSGAQETGSTNQPSGNAAAAGMGGGSTLGVKVMGALLGAVVVVAGFL